MTDSKLNKFVLLFLFNLKQIFFVFYFKSEIQKSFLFLIKDIIYKIIYKVSIKMNYLSNKINDLNNVKFLFFF